MPSAAEPHAQKHRAALPTGKTAPRNTLTLLVSPLGLEPRTRGLKGRCSAIELGTRMAYIYSFSILLVYCARRQTAKATAY
jgi:hypothetical protein